MIIIKFAKQKMDVIENAQPDLKKTLDINLPDVEERTKGIVAGLIIEYVLKSGGNPSIFQSVFDDYITEEFIID